MTYNTLMLYSFKKPTEGRWHSRKLRKRNKKYHSLSQSSKKYGRIIVRSRGVLMDIQTR